MDLKTRRRGPELEDAILEAARDVLLERGYPGFTYEAVAARAETSRPVLYRRWPQRQDMLVATLRRFWWSEPIAVPDTGSLRTDAIAFLRNADAVRTRMILLLSVQMMEFFRDTGTSFHQLREQLRPAGQPSGFETIVARAVERGELSGMPVSPRVTGLPFDLLRGELLMTMQPVPDDKITEIVDDVWLPLLAVAPKEQAPTKQAPTEPAPEEQATTGQAAKEQALKDPAPEEATNRQAT